MSAATSDRVEQHLRRIEAADQGRPRRRVTIIGAGMAGLVAAHELERLGHTVRVFEASSETKGRVRTHRFADGTYGEMGAMRIPINHDYTRHYVQKLGLPLRKFVTSHENLSCFYDIRGVRTRMRGAPDALYPEFDLSMQQREDPIPPKMLARAVSDVIEGLTDDERASLRTGDLETDRVREVDRMTMGDFLRVRAGSDGAELIGAATGLEQMYDRCATMLLRDAVAAVGDHLDEIVGGMDLLPTGLATTIKGEIVRRAPVRGICPRPDGGVDLVVERDGTRMTEKCDVVVCTMPFSVLRTIDVDPAFSPAKMFAIRNLGYESSTKVLLHCTRRFWEIDDGIAGGASQTDTLARAIYYPSDNARAVSDSTPSQARFNTMYGGYRGGDFEPASPEVSRGPGVLLASYTWGQDGRRLGQLSPEDRVDVITRLVARLHPQIAEPGVVDEHASFFWDQYPWANGSFCELEPGQQGTIHNDAKRPEAGVHFAGEHTSLDTGWIQGAVTSAFRAVEEIASS